jgi:hypothetical protein
MGIKQVAEDQSRPRLELSTAADVSPFPLFLCVAWPWAFVSRLVRRRSPDRLSDL